MRPALRLALAVLCLLIGFQLTASAQVAYNEGPVERVVLVHIVPGHFDAFMADMKKNVVPLFEAEKASGVIMEYHLFLNTTHSPSDNWEFGYSLVYKNMAALDGLPDKMYELRMKHFGDTTAEQKVLDKRYENAQLVNSMLLRGITMR